MTPSSISPPYWIRMALYAILPIIVILVALEAGPGTRAEDAGLPMMLGCGSVLASLVGGGAWR